mmetsp:Transcript_14085/g.38751  ORF Transcript_14085/g.38751 Transcript_14085/m.38751 type:complete len:140 (+) Transcript_14085:1020-1439(+)
MFCRVTIEAESDIIFGIEWAPHTNRHHSHQQSSTHQCITISCEYNVLAASPSHFLVRTRSKELQQHCHGHNGCVMGEHVMWWVPFRMMAAQAESLRSLSRAARAHAPRPTHLSASSTLHLLPSSLALSCNAHILHHCHR